MADREWDIHQTWVDSRDTLPMASAADFFRRPTPAPRVCRPAPPARRPAVPDKLRAAAVDYLSQPRSKGLAAEVASRHNVTQWELLGAAAVEAQTLGADGILHARELLQEQRGEMEMKRIDEKLRSKVVALVDSGLSFKDAAERVGVSITSVSRFVHDARNADVNEGEAPPSEADDAATPAPTATTPVARTPRGTIDHAGELLKGLTLEQLAQHPGPVARAALELVLQLRGRAEGA